MHTPFLGFLCGTGSPYCVSVREKLAGHGVVMGLFSPTSAGYMKEHMNLGYIKALIARGTRCARRCANTSVCTVETEYQTELSVDQSFGFLVF